MNIYRLKRFRKRFKIIQSTIDSRIFRVIDKKDIAVSSRLFYDYSDAVRYALNLTLNYYASLNRREKIIRRGAMVNANSYFPK